jgi:hypothetical protein
MRFLCRNSWLLQVLAAIAALSAGTTDQARAQLGEVLSSPQFELAETVQVDAVEGTVLANLERVKAYLANRRWDEAVETLRQIMENSEGKLVPAGSRRYVNLREYCQMQLAAMPAEALKLYRSRVDAAAEKWYQEGIAERNSKLLRNVLDRSFASSWGDKALWALGEIDLESGDFTSARWCWERIMPIRLPSNQMPAWLSYPDTSLDLASIRARLVLVSILEGSPERARDELAQFVRLHQVARGRWGGQEVNYAQALTSLLAESSNWPARKPTADWPTFAGFSSRNAIAPELIDVGEAAWRIPLHQVKPAVNAAVAGVAENAQAPLSYHPVLVGDVVLINDQAEIRAIRASTGKRAWGKADGVIFRDPLDKPPEDLSNPANTLGTARFTMTVHEGKLFARMGRAITGRPRESTLRASGGYLVCLDLAAEGQLLWEITAKEGWAMEGSPVCDGSNVYVAMRRGDILAQAHVACLDAQTGRQRWRRMVCAADTPDHGALYQSTHNLLTLEHGTLYYNTNLGAVAAISAEDGRVLWVTLYPRQRTGNLAKPAPHWQRDLNPCLFDRGTLLVAPADSPQIFAIDASTGQILWETGSQTEDAVHLLGVAGDCLIAGGRRLYWISLKPADAGRIKYVWPDSNARPGYGRGILSGDCVLFPTRETVNGATVDSIRVFDQKTAHLIKNIDLRYRGEPPVSAGNLLIADGRLLIATGTELISLGRQAVIPYENVDKLTEFKKVKP